VNLILFDVDGTLVDTSADDDRLYCEALRECMPEDAREVTIGPWEDYPDATDPAIAREVIAQACHRAAREAEIVAVRERFIAKWETALESGAITVRPRPGALAIVAAAAQRPRTLVAIASGGWGPTTAMKLSAAGFSLDDVVIASADDSESRVGIFNTAGIFAAASRGVPGLSGTVIVGDGVWDLRTAGALRAGFVGVAGTPENAQRLRHAGATVIVPHFEPAGNFWQAVDTALAHRRSAEQN
jgi:phosphoglycolate phosphatase-like HAD superfamily hydrolase